MLMEKLTQERAGQQPRQEMAAAAQELAEAEQAPAGVPPAARPAISTPPLRRGFYGSPAQRPAAAQATLSIEG
jgi:hypothetical protein